MVLSSGPPLLHPPFQDTHMHPEGIGQSVLRREDSRLLEGRGQYVADLFLEGMLHCAFVRSPHAHARIGSIDTTAAAQAPGCVAVLTGMDMKADSVGKMTPLWLIPGADNTRLIEPPRWSMAQDRVRHVGEIVAVVIAFTAARGPLSMQPLSAPRIRSRSIWSITASFVPRSNPARCWSSLRPHAGKMATP